MLRQIRKHMSPLTRGAFSFSSYNKVYPTGEEALKDIKDGAVLAVSGFGVAGVPENTLQILRDMKVGNLTMMSNSMGLEDYGHGWLLQDELITKVLATYVGENPLFASQYLNGKVEVTFTPQGSFCERYRSSHAGIPAFFTPTGFGTMIHHGGHGKLLDPKTKKPIAFTTGKETREFEGKFYVMETAIKGNFGLIRAHMADKKGNLRFRKTARNFNTDIAGCCEMTIVEAENIVDELPPDRIHTPGYMVDRVFQGKQFSKKIERLRTRTEGGSEEGEKVPVKLTKKEIILRRAVQEFKGGFYCNLGIGIPTAAANLVTDKVEINLQSENGILQMGPYPLPDEVDHDMINASKETTTGLPGYSITSSSDSFGMMRGKHLHMTMLGGLQVSQTGDLANWIIPGSMVKGMGGAMDLVAASERVVVTMEHVAKDGSLKVLQSCSLPLTGKAVCSRLITDIAVFDFDSTGMKLIELAPGVTLQEVQDKTHAHFKVAEDLKVMNLEI